MALRSAGCRRARLGAPGSVEIRIEYFNEGFLPVCKVTCNPLDQDCEGEDNCYQLENGYLCGGEDIPDGLGRAGDLRDTAQHCSKGLNCQAPETSIDCDADEGCCSPFCDTEGDDATSCTVEGEVCVPLLADNPPPGRENVGVCGRVTR